MYTLQRLLLELPLRGLKFKCLATVPCVCVWYLELYSVNERAEKPDRPSKTLEGIVLFARYSRTDCFIDKR